MNGLQGDYQDLINNLQSLDVKNIKDTGYDLVHREEFRIGRFNLAMDTIMTSEGGRPYTFMKFKQGIVALVYFEGKFWVTQCYRPPVDRFGVELLTGTVDPGESPSQAAMRECEEELGIKIGKCVYLIDGEASPGSTSEQTYMFLMIGVGRVPIHQDASELVRSYGVTQKELRQLIGSGKMKHTASMLTALLGLDRLKKIINENNNVNKTAFFEQTIQH